LKAISIFVPFFNDSCKWPFLQALQGSQLFSPLDIFNLRCFPFEIVFDSKIETLSISDEEITSIIEDATDVKILKSSTRGRKSNNNNNLNRTLNI